MKFTLGIVTHFGELVTEAENTIRDSIVNGRIPDEPSITNRFLQQLETTINRSEQVQGVQFRARTLSSLGPNAEEAEVGADFVAVIDVQLPGFSMQKGFLCQAKNVGSGIDVVYTRPRTIRVGFTRASELRRLQNQTKKSWR